MKIINTFYLLSFCVATIACESRKELEINDYKLHVSRPENGLFKTVEEGPLKIEVQYRPKDLMVYHQTGENASKEEWNNAAKEFDSLEYFVMRLSSNGHEVANYFSGDAAKFNNLLQYLNGGIAVDVNFRTNNVKLNIVNV